MRTCRECGKDISGKDEADIIVGKGYVCHECFDRVLKSDGYLNWGEKMRRGEVDG